MSTPQTVNSPVASPPIPPADLDAEVADVLGTTPVIDIHTHLFPAGFDGLALWGIDELLTYHYLEAELFRFSSVQPVDYWAMSKAQRAELIWSTLFLENTPLSEATRGVVAVLHALGIDPSSSLADVRDFFGSLTLADHVPHVLALAGISDVVMTNDPLDVAEIALWESGMKADPGFHAALRLDRILNDWDAHHSRLQEQGYAVEAHAGGSTVSQVRRFLQTWAARLDPVYMAVSLPDTFEFPTDDVRTRLIANAVLPACRELRMPLALMIGVRRQVNPKLRLAGDGLGRTDLRAVATLCSEFPDNRFMVSVLSRENQHELCVLARKFSNLLPFGCWWFLNNRSIVEEITRERLEMLGTSFVPQHSDARVLEQVIYKWKNTRRTMAPILAGSYRQLAEDGRRVTRSDIERDVRALFRTNFQALTNRTWQLGMEERSE
jgi:hypothetical protein